MRIIPAIDIIDGKCVRLTQGDYQQKKIYAENPLEMALQFEDAGIQHLHLVDLDGAKAGKVINWEVVEHITSKTGLNVDFGGGVKTKDELDRLLDLGVKQVTCGSLAVKKPEVVKAWAEQVGHDQIIIGADAKNGKIAINGWQEETQTELAAFVEDFHKSGFDYFVCTDIATDGMLTGPNIALYQQLLNALPTIKLIASGGVSAVKDLEELIKIDVDGAIVGKAYYEGKITLEQLNQLQNA